MDVFTMVVIIVVVSMSYAAYETHVKAKTKTRGSKATETELTALREELARVKDRVRVLETIVTDKDRVLADEIRKLA